MSVLDAAQPGQFVVVYDATNDNIAGGYEYGLIFVAATVGWTALWTMLFYVLRQTEARQRVRWRMGWCVGGALLVLAAVVVATETYPAYAAQCRCKEWLRQGNFQSIVGQTANYSRGPGRRALARFQVGSERFEYRVGATDVGGFCGRFTERVARSLNMRNGLEVRIDHKDGRILRISVLVAASSE